MFIDKTKIYVKAGAGGNGAIAFHREKYVAAGGPDGGDGGNGGSIVLRVDDNLSTLMDFRYKRKYVAPNGMDGQGGRCKGKRGEDLIIKVPRGTVVRDSETNEVIKDMSDSEDFILCKGGRGGWGNQHFATPTRQVPRFAKAGLPGEEHEVILELKLLADVGLVGFPNVGKSTLLSRVSNARPKIANYHFTTLNPHLGVVDLPDMKSFVIADIPGLIEGASEGVGLGHEFLRHIERTKVLIHVVDAAGTEGRDPITDIYAINAELANYSEELARKPQVIAANKTDAIYDLEESPVEQLRKEFGPKGIDVFPISAVSGKGVNELLYHVRQMLDGLDEKPTVFEQEYFPEMALAVSDEPYTVTYDELEQEYVVEGPRIEKMLGYTNLESEKGFAFFQGFLKDAGILDKLEELGIQEGDTVRMYGLSFDYYK